MIPFARAPLTLLPTTLKVVLMFAVLASFVATLTFVFRAGQTRAEAEAAQEQIEARQQIDRLETQRLTLQRERDRLRAELKDQALADPVRSPDCLSVDRVRRLNLAE